MKNCFGLFWKFSIGNSRGDEDGKWPRVLEKCPESFVRFHRSCRLKKNIYVLKNMLRRKKSKNMFRQIFFEDYVWENNFRKHIFRKICFENIFRKICFEKIFRKIYFETYFSKNFEGGQRSRNYRRRSPRTGGHNYRRGLTPALQTTPSASIKALRVRAVKYGKTYDARWAGGKAWKRLNPKKSKKNCSCEYALALW